MNYSQTLPAESAKPSRALQMRSLNKSHLSPHCVRCTVCYRQACFLEGQHCPLTYAGKAQTSARKTDPLSLHKKPSPKLFNLVHALPGISIKDMSRAKLMWYVGSARSATPSTSGTSGRRPWQQNKLPEAALIHQRPRPPGPGSSLNRETDQCFNALVQDWA